MTKLNLKKFEAILIDNRVSYNVDTTYPDVSLLSIKEVEYIKFYMDYQQLKIEFEDGNTLWFTEFGPEDSFSYNSDNHQLVIIMNIKE